MMPFTVLFLLFLLMLILVPSLKIGIQARYDGQLLVRIKAGPLMLRVFPFPKIKIKWGKSDKGKKPKKEKTAMRRITFEAVRQLLIDCIDPLLDSVGRVRRGLRVHRLMLHLTLGGETDPAAAAQQYGQLNAVAWPLLAALERIVTVERRDVRWNIDFSAPRSHCEGELYLTLRIHHVMRIAARNGVRFLRALLRFLKATKAEKSAAADNEQNQRNGNGKGR